jgi:hypothetical protein
MPWNYVGWSGPTRQQRDQLAVQVITSGGARRPSPPRSITAQPGCNAALLTWCTAPENLPTCKARVYLSTESNQVAELPAGTNQFSLPLTGGATPPISTAFVSFISPAGAESTKYPIKVQAAAQAGSTPPPNPPPPPQWPTEPTGGGGSNPKLNMFGGL